MLRFKKIKKRYIALGILIIVIILLVFVGKHHNGSYIEHVVQKQTVSDNLLLAGIVEAKERVDLGFASSGRVKKVNFNIGDSVKKGDVIAEIEQNYLESELTKAQANYTLTRVDTSINLESAQDGLEKQLAEQNSIVDGLYQEYLSGDLQAYNMDENGTRNFGIPVISGSYSGVKEGEYIVDVYNSASLSGSSFRLSGLENGVYTAEVYQPGKMGEIGLYIQFNENSNYNNSKWVVPVPNTRSSSYLSRKTAYENAVKTRDRIIADLENELARVSSVDSDTKISRGDAERQQSLAQVNAVYAQLGDGKIRAPFDGIIAKNELDVGEIVNAFTIQVVMFASNEKELHLNTPEIYINKISVGDSVDIIFDAFDKEVFKGTVQFIDFIDTEVDGVPVYETKVLLDEIDQRIRSGMNAKASIISEKKDNVLAIPAHYITTKNGIHTVMVSGDNEGDDYDIRNIELGLRGNDGFVEVTKGLQEGEVIFIETE